MSLSVKAVLAARAAASGGVTYSARLGAVCPLCGMAKMPVQRTEPWEGNVRVRWHKCPKKSCLIHALGLNVKSVQVEARESIAAVAASS